MSKKIDEASRTLRDAVKENATLLPQPKAKPENHLKGERMKRDNKGTQPARAS